MAAAASFDALIDRIEEVLCEGRGTASVLATGDRFGRIIHPDMAPDVKARHAHRKKQCWVEITEQTPRAEQSGGSIIHAAILVRVEMSYHVGAVEKHSDLVRVAKLAANDSFKVRAALEHSGNLAATEAGDPTGLGGGHLVFVRWVNGRPNAVTRELRPAMVLKGSVDITKP